jgi:hypothetical protein
MNRARVQNCINNGPVVAGALVVPQVKSVKLLRATALSPDLTSPVPWTANVY